MNYMKYSFKHRSVPNSHSQDVLDMEYARRRAFNT